MGHVGLLSRQGLNIYFPASVERDAVRDRPYLEVNRQVPLIAEAEVGGMCSQSLYAGLGSTLPLKPPHEVHAHRVFLEQEHTVGSSPSASEIVRRTCSELHQDCKGQHGSRRERLSSGQPPNNSNFSFIRALAMTTDSATPQVGGKSLSEAGCSATRPGLPK